MKTLLAIIITATLSFGCAILESEQTTVVSGGGGIKSAPSTSVPAVTSWSGTKQLGTSSPDHAYGIATDPGGNVYVTGHTNGGLDGNTNAGSSDLFVVKYDSGGIKQWVQQLGTSSPELAYGITTDTSGNIYVTGATWGGLHGNTNVGSDDLFVVKYDSEGIKQWVQQLESSSLDRAYGIATDTGGNVYVTGSTSGGLDGNTNAGSDDIFVVKYDSSGVKQ